MNEFNLKVLKEEIEFLFNLISNYDRFNIKQSDFAKSIVLKIQSQLKQQVESLKPQPAIKESKNNKQKE
jgi:hypothetical protein